MAVSIKRAAKKKNGRVVFSVVVVDTMHKTLANMDCTRLTLAEFEVALADVLHKPTSKMSVDEKLDRVGIHAGTAKDLRRSLRR